MMPIGEKLLCVKEILRASSPVLIAYSGGVDSATLLAIAADTEGLKFEAVIADSPSLPRKSLENAISEACRIGVTVRVLATQELNDANYAANPPNRCYFCKKELFAKMESAAREGGFAAIAYGENADDIAGDRPGNLAAREFSVLAPLRAAGIGKKEIRDLATEYQLLSADLPAQPCLSSRVPFGMKVTREALARIERAEEVVREQGFRIVRVRHSEKEGRLFAKVLVAPEEVAGLLAQKDSLCARLEELGFSEVDLDPAGYQGRTD